MNIAKRLKEHAGKKRSEVATEYRRLLLLPDFTPSDEVELLNVLQILGRSIDDVANDGELLAQANRCIGLIAEAPDLLRRQLDHQKALSEAESQKGKAIQKAHDDYEIQLKTLRAEHSPNATRLLEAREAEKRLDAMRSKLVEIFGSDPQWAARVKL